MTGNENVSSVLDKQILITISREYGSGGRYIGKMVADRLGIKLYDKDLIIKLAERTGLSEEYIERTEEKRNILSNIHKGYYTGPDHEDELFIKESQIIEEIADKESCVIIGRCADYILKDNDSLVRIYIYSNMADKVKGQLHIMGLIKIKQKRDSKK